LGAIGNLITPIVAAIIMLLALFGRSQALRKAT
jgi:hypothetical protein